MTYVLHGDAASPFHRKVHVVLEEKGLPYEVRELIPLPKTPELLEKHPLGLIPVLEHEGRYVPDSSVICAYLARLHPEPAIFPKDAPGFARALFLEEYADTRAAQAFNPILFERYIKPRFFAGQTDEAVVEKQLREDVPGVLDYLEQQLRPGADTLLPGFSIADAAFGAQLASLLIAGEPPDARRWPKVAVYAEKLLARPSFQASMPR